MLKTAIVMLLAIALMGSTLATSGRATKEVVYSDISINIRGTNTANGFTKITPTDVNGVYQEPFKIDGTVYLPVRAVSEALGLTVNWDQDTQSVNIGGYSNYYKNRSDYDTFPISMRMQAGYNEYEEYSGGGRTIHAGEGYIDPFGVGSYHAGIGYPEAEEYPLDLYFSDWWMENMKTDLFCIYHFADGDIYAWDGILGGITGDTGEGEADREDVLLNIIVGGTGAYKGAAGILVGRTLGAGEYGQVTDTMALPQALFKSLDGYIRLPKDPDGYEAPTVTQERSGETAAAAAADFVTIKVDMNMKAGAHEHDNWTSGFWTIHSGIGYLEPFGHASYHAGMGYEEQVGQPTDFFNDNMMDMLSPDLFCIYHTEYGEIYVYDGLWAYMLQEDEETSGKVGTTAQRQDALVNIVIGGTGAFEGASGILVGRTLGAGDYIQCGFMPEEIVGVKDTVPYTLPETLLKQMTGYINVPATSEVAKFAK